MVFKKKKFWGMVIALGLLAFCFKDINLADLRSLSKRVDYWFLIPSTCCAFGFYIFRALRWRLMVSQQKSLPMVRGTLLYSAGQILNAVMPALTGQVGRIILFSRKVGLRKTFVFSTILLEIIFDAVSLILFLLVTSLTFVFPGEYRPASIIVATIVVVVIVILYLILMYQFPIEEFGRKHVRHRWPGMYITVKKFIRSFVKGIEMLKSSKYLVRSMVYSLLQWLTHILVIYFLMHSFGFGLSFPTAVAVMIMNQVAVMIPITPGNAGTFEVIVSNFLAHAFSVPMSDSVLFAVALHILDLLPVFTLGFIFLHVEKVSITEIRAGHEEESVLDRLTEDGNLIENEEQA